MHGLAILSGVGRFSRRALLAATLFGLALASATSARAGDPEFRVIVNPSNGLAGVDREFAADAFLKKITRWPDGAAIRPVDLRADNPVRRRFSDDVLKRSVAAVRSYWQQRIFSGRDVPPPELDSEDAVITYVAHNAGAVGYVSGGAKLTGVRELALH